MSIDLSVDLSVDLFVRYEAGKRKELEAKAADRQFAGVFETRGPVPNAHWSGAEQTSQTERTDHLYMDSMNREYRRQQRDRARMEHEAEVAASALNIEIDAVTARLAVERLTKQAEGRKAKVDEVQARVLAAEEAKAAAFFGEKRFAALREEDAEKVADRLHSQLTAKEKAREAAEAKVREAEAKKASAFFKRSVLDKDEKAAAVDRLYRESEAKKARQQQRLEEEEKKARAVSKGPLLQTGRRSQHRAQKAQFLFPPPPPPPSHLLTIRLASWFLCPDTSAPLAFMPMCPCSDLSFSLPRL